LNIILTSDEVRYNNEEDNGSKKIYLNDEAPKDDGLYKEDDNQEVWDDWELI